jgi:hypothetical protein
MESTKMRPTANPEARYHEDQADDGDERGRQVLAELARGIPPPEPVPEPAAAAPAAAAPAPRARYDRD